MEFPRVGGHLHKCRPESVRGDLLIATFVRAPPPSGSWPGTGRLIDLPMTTFSAREYLGETGGLAWLERLVSAGTDIGLPAEMPDLLGYIEIALGGGFPEPITSLGERGRARWYAGYVRQLLDRDVGSLTLDVDAPRLVSYLRSYALNSAGVTEHSTIFSAAGINRKTADRYEALLEALFLVERLPAWTTNRLKRLVMQPKRLLVDTGLWGSLVGVHARDVMADGNLIGRLLETFVVAQLRAELPLMPFTRLHHLRTEGGRQEVDIVAEIGAERVVGIEVTATASPGRNDGKHLAWLRDQLHEKFSLGVVLHTGPQAYQLGERIIALPICALWGPN